MKFFVFCLTLLIPLCGSAQSNDFQSQYESFKQQAHQQYTSFREQANKDYADFMRQAWESYQSLPAIPKPKDDKLPPVVIKEEDKKQPIIDKPVVIEEEITIPYINPQPTPISPIREQVEPINQSFAFSFYGTEMQVRLSDELKFRLANTEADQLAQAWEILSDDKYNNVIRDCLELRIRHNLCDWNYLQMLSTLCNGFLGSNTNEAELLKAYLYCQSGYQMRLAISNNHLYMLYGSQHFIYDKPYWQIDNLLFYSDNEKVNQIKICEAAFPNEQPLSLYIPKEPTLYHKESNLRTLQAEGNDGIKAEVSENENLMAIYNDYPTSVVGDDVMTRWAMYANTPLSNHAKQMLYPKLQQQLQDKTLAASVNALCHWVQTAFVYEYDDKIWGGDRAFFADETLYYPYCDCEDRSILLTRIVRDLLGLSCALVYYPGHLATAIAIGDDVKGDYLLIAGKKYLVCDPTYIGAPIGMTMPDMDNKSAKVIVLTN